MKNFFKGFIIGIGKIIPGVSGALIAISLGVYDKALSYLCNFNVNKKESIKYLFPIVLGIVLSIIFFSKIISLSLVNYYVITMLFFVGLIIGGIPSIVNKVKKKDYYISFLSFILFFLISINNMNNIYIPNNNIIDFLIFFISGILEAIGTVVPGVSSTALLMIMGTYNIIIYSIGNLTDFKILVPFIFGFLFGLLGIVKILDYLIKKFENKLYSFVLGILISSIVLLIIQIFKVHVNFYHLLLGIVFLILGIIISTLIEDKK